MDTRQIAIFAAIAVVLGFRLYKKYGNKGNANTGFGKPKETSFPSSSKDEEYEPYSKK